MNRRELVNALAAETETSPKEADQFLKGFTDVVTATVASGEPVNISGFAKFVKVDRPARMGRNPATGEQMQFKASKKARITPLKAFKDAVMSGKAGSSTQSGAKKATAKKSAAKKGPAKKATARKTTAKKSRR